jgi:HEAT repeat protein/predicted KAP-like P-loop ATPase
MLSDRETTRDVLGFKLYVDSLYNVVLSPRITPFTIGIYGKWGTGKTSLMKMLKEKLDKKNNIKTVWFNAWKFEKEKDMWVALIQTLLNEIEVKDQSKLEEAKRIIKKLRYGINWIQMAGFITSVALQRPDFDKLSQALDLNLRDRIESIYDFEKEFERLVELSGVDLLVVFIDDLDRCKKDATMHILEVMKLFLYSRKCIYILGLDHEKICQAITSRFPEDVAEEYLDKIVQLPFFIPKTRIENMGKFLRYLIMSQYVSNENSIRDLIEKIYTLREDEFDFGIKRNSFYAMKEEQILEYLDFINLEEVIIEENDRNPRKIKKFLNMYFLRRYIKENSDMELQNKYIIKFLLLQLKHPNFHKDLEKYWNLLEELQSLSPMEENERMKKLQGSDLLSKYFEEKKLMSFLEKMKYEDVDPRPYLSLSEIGTPSILSLNEIEIIEDLQSTDSIRISNAKERYSQLQEDKKEYFIKMILQSTNDIETGRAKDILVLLGSIAVNPLITFLEMTEDINIQKTILDVLGEIGDPKTVEPLILLMENKKDNFLELSILDSLGKMGIPAIDPLLALLERKDDNDSRNKISKILGRIGAPATVPLVSLLEKSDDVKIQTCITYALGEIEDPKAVKPLMALLKKTADKTLRITIIKSLGKIGDSRVVTPLASLLKSSSDLATRGIIILTLGNIGDPKVLKTLESFKKSTKDNVLRDLIYEAIEKIKSK